ncbi:MAG: chemotaxis protein CheV [Proteobacteria bacterium]|nr:chemotaxis protein CheV [Pseudomonadota bacterium]
MAASTSVLTDVGTNELEIVEFFVDGRPYAINVAKVREIIRPGSMMAVPESHPCVVGVFRNREDVIPLVDLGKWLGSSEAPDPQHAKVVVAEFNQMKIGFLVHRVSRIHRVTWADLETPSRGSMTESRSALGYMRLGRGTEEGERIVFLLDFERIVAELKPVEPATSGSAADAQAGRRHGRVVLVAEDSGLIRKLMVRELESGGYTVAVTTNGEEAWERLSAGPRVDAVISDIEMPRMDGHHLTRRIKGDETLRGIPVVLYSSMIYEEMRKKGEAVGADAQICKPDLARLVHTVDELLFS